MSQQKKLEKVLALLVNEDTSLATELLHQIIVEKARTIYESIVNEEDDEEDDIEDDDTVGGDSDDDFTDEISSDTDEIETDELNDGEPGEDDEELDGEFGGDEFGDEFGDDLGAEDERIDDLEDQLAQLRAEFDALMAQEVEEPNHADLDLDIAADDDFGGDDFGGDEFGGEEEFITASMYESKKLKAKEKANKAKEKEIDPKAKVDPKAKAKSKVAEETQFTKGVADTGQKGSAPGFAGTGKNTPKGAEQPRTPFTKAPSKPSYGGDPVKIGKGTGGEYGKYNGDSATDDTPSDNVDEKTKSVTKVNNKEDWTGTGKESGSFGAQQKKSPFTKKPS